MVDDTVELVAKEQLAASRRALLREMGFQTPVAGTHDLPIGDQQAVRVVDSSFRIKRPPLWRVVAGKAVERWWTHHPLVVASRIVQPALRPYARQHPAMLMVGGAAAGAALYVLRPWRLLSITSLALLVLRGPALPRKALKLVQASMKKSKSI